MHLHSIPITQKPHSNRSCPLTLSQVQTAPTMPDASLCCCYRNKPCYGKKECLKTIFGYTSEVLMTGRGSSLSKGNVCVCVCVCVCDP